jgi:hypothetical protein
MVWVASGKDEGGQRRNGEKGGKKKRWTWEIPLSHFLPVSSFFFSAVLLFRRCAFCALRGHLSGA